MWTYQRTCTCWAASLGPCYTVPVGFAYHLKHEGKGNIAVAYSGDGCTCEGPFYEAMNMAAAFKLPMLMIIQNNFFAISEDFRKMSRPAEPEHAGGRLRHPRRHGGERQRCGDGLQ